MNGTHEKQTSEFARSANQHIGTRENLTQKRLKELLDYDPDTGIFRWKVSRSNRIKQGEIAGCFRPDGYQQIRINSKLYMAHRLAFMYIEGYFPEAQVDHVDRNPSNNKWDNLRHVSHACNMKNCKIGKNNKSGITGVSWNATNKKWSAQIKVNYKQYFMGFFCNITEAAKARWKAEVKYGFPNCNTTSSAYNYLNKLKINER